jgi:hypothetical protein
MTRITFSMIARRRTLAGASILAALTLLSCSSGSPSTTSPSTIALALNNGDQVMCRSTADGARCTITGKAQVPSGAQVLLWVEPVNPPSQTSGYYLQQSPSGVTQQPPPGASTWAGTIQIGDAQYPPCPGDTFNVIATLDDANTAATLISQSQQTQTISDPTQQSFASTEVDNLIVRGVSSSCNR